MKPPSATNAAPLVVGIDIGGTKTHLRAFRDGEGRIDAGKNLVLPSSEWRSRDWQEDADRLLELVFRLTAGHPLAAIGIGAHGCDDVPECDSFTAAIAARCDVPAVVVNDAELMPWALDLPGAIGLVAGTGSIAVCRSTDQGMMTAGGWGWLIGDDGSAAGLVRESARKAAHHLDAGGAPDEPLLRALSASLSLSALPRLGSALGTLGNAAAIGAHAPAVFAAAEKGSALALATIREGGEALARLVLHLVERGAPTAHVVAGGSVIVAQPLLWRAFCEALAGAASGRITPHLFTEKPVEGACRLAVSLARSRNAGPSRTAAKLQ
ncbi:BadF/BadG/BcrA/BcrD ATPase family protein [Consotaella salsifontis]|uniref:BadF-type ATPase n=1 Tax=Consotaella salsifontis TaxID=1365950 RepID=A0A1T4SHB8_9HYPH|nr:BadF/BadG/BcrA/BcrD ATPase family protein [Consotaella salsifontis]SKA27201.1 BadF-type ATPase [Consotaella salsifontis]